MQMYYLDRKLIFPRQFLCFFSVLTKGKGEEEEESKCTVFGAYIS